MSNNIPNIFFFHHNPFINKKNFGNMEQISNKFNKKKNRVANTFKEK